MKFLNDDVRSGGRSLVNTPTRWDTIRCPSVFGPAPMTKSKSTLLSGSSQDRVQRRARWYLISVPDLSLRGCGSPYRSVRTATTHRRGLEASSETFAKSSRAKFGKSSRKTMAPASLAVFTCSKRRAKSLGDLLPRKGRTRLDIVYVPIGRRGSLSMRRRQHWMRGQARS